MPAPVTTTRATLLSRRSGLRHNRGGVERRIAAGLNPEVGSVASVFVSRWDVAVAKTVPAALVNQLGIATSLRTYKAYSELLASARWRRLANEGARAQRLLWASI